MKRYYSEVVSIEIAKKIEDKLGYVYYMKSNNAVNITYAEVFDMLMEYDIDAEVYLSMTRSEDNRIAEKIYAWIVNTPHGEHESGEEDSMSWHKAAETAINKALELI